MTHLLCLQLKRIGDTVLTAPALAALRAAYSDARLTVVLHGPSAGVGPALEAVDEVLTYHPGRTNLGLWARVVTGQWTACYDFTGTDRSALMARLSRALRVYGYRKFVEKKAWRTAGYTDLSNASVRDLHTVDFFLALTQQPDRGLTGWRVPENVVQGTAAKLGSAFATATARGHVVLHPGSARTEKLWPAESWAEVAATLIKQHDLPVVLTGSAEASEQAHLAAFKRALSHHGVASEPPQLFDVSGQLSLLEVATLIAQARLVLSVDSAAMHLAAMSQTPQIALFGPTNPFHWRPRHDRARVLQASGDTLFAPRHQARPMAELSADRVLHTVAELLQH